MKQLTIIIDGNNLAYYLYDIPDKSYLHIYDHMLYQHLSSWASNFEQDIIVELCLDPCPCMKDIEDSLPITLYYAEPGQKADDVILERLYYYPFDDYDCLVVTKDGKLRRDIESRGYRVIRPEEFVIIRGKEKPKFYNPRKIMKRSDETALDFNDIGEYFEVGRPERSKRQIAWSCYPPDC